MYEVTQEPVTLTRIFLNGERTNAQAVKSNVPTSYVNVMSRPTRIGRVTFSYVRQNVSNNIPAETLKAEYEAETTALANRLANYLRTLRV